MRTLLLDIETAPNTVYCWGLWEQNIAHDQVIQSSRILCWAAKWLGTSTMMFMSCEKTTTLAMLKGMHDLLDNADVVIHFNGRKFDVPTLNKEFIKYKFPPPSPYRQVDLYSEVKRTFRFESNKMDSVTKILDLGRKTRHKGFELWVGCMKGDAQCWKQMEQYNKQDVVLLERLYKRMLPWMPSSPNRAIVDGQSDACPKCGVTSRLQSRGKLLANTKVYRRFQCQACGGWCRSRTSEKGAAPVYV